MQDVLETLRQETTGQDASSREVSNRKTPRIEPTAGAKARVLVDARHEEMSAVMAGFDARWTTPADFILGITKEIWEDRQLHTLRHYYADTLAVRTPASIVVGNAKVIGATMATLAEWPDRRLLGEDVIWCPIEGGGFLSSHRLLCTATHTHPGAYGDPTGKPLRYRILADCAVRDNHVFDEWLVRDQGAIARQIGQTPRAFALDLIDREGGMERAVRPFHPDHDQDVQYLGGGNDHEVGHRHADLLTRMMAGEMSVIKREYDRAAALDYPGNVTAHGRAAADTFWMGLRAALPDARFTVHHQVGRTDPLFAPRSSLRWSLTGKHDGWGMFGAPTGVEVHVMGLSHAEFGPWGLRREWTLIDEVAIWKQIALQQG